MTYNLISAAKATGKSKSTILRSIQNGRISASKDDVGGWVIDPAELHRVFPPVAAEPPKTQPMEHGATNATVNEIEVLKARLEAKDELLRAKEELLEQVQGERDNLREQNARLTALLPPPKPEPAEEAPRRGLFGWFRR